MQFIRLVSNAHGRTTQNVAGSNEYRVPSQFFNGHIGLGDIPNVKPFGLVDTELIEQLAELVSVFRHVNIFRMRAEDLRTRFVQTFGQIVGDLSSHTDHDAFRLLMFVQVEDRFEADFLE